MLKLSELLNKAVVGTIRQNSFNKPGCCLFVSSIGLDPGGMGLRLSQSLEHISAQTIPKLVQSAEGFGFRCPGAQKRLIKQVLVVGIRREAASDQAFVS